MLLVLFCFFFEKKILVLLFICLFIIIILLSSSLTLIAPYGGSAVGINLIQAPVLHPVSTILILVLVALGMLSDL
jgi:hypothetical protein